MRKCMQEKCAFNQGVAGCPRCDDCNCSPLWVNDDCKMCKKCEGKEGEIRGGSKGNKLDEKKPIEVTC